MDASARFALGCALASIATAANTSGSEDSDQQASMRTAHPLLPPATAAYALLSSPRAVADDADGLHCQRGSPLCIATPSRSHTQGRMPNDLQFIPAAMLPPSPSPPQIGHGYARICCRRLAVARSYRLHARSFQYIGSLGKNSLSHSPPYAHNTALQPGPQPVEEEMACMVPRAVAVRIAVAVASLAACTSVDGYADLGWTERNKRLCKLCAPCPLALPRGHTHGYRRLHASGTVPDDARGPLLRIPTLVVALPIPQQLGHAQQCPSPLSPSLPPHFLLEYLSMHGCQAEKTHAELSVHTVDRRLHLRRRLLPSSRGWVPMPHLNIHSYPCSRSRCRHAPRGSRDSSILPRKSSIAAGIINPVMRTQIPRTAFLSLLISSHRITTLILIQKKAFP